MVGYVYTGGLYSVYTGGLYTGIVFSRQLLHLQHRFQYILDFSGKTSLIKLRNSRACAACVLVCVCIYVCVCVCNAKLCFGLIIEVSLVA